MVRRATGTQKRYYRVLRGETQLFPPVQPDPGPDPDRLPMCLLILAHRAHARYPLLVAANRDEFHARPTAPSRFWGEYPDLLAGRDLEQGGTWMGLTRGGRFAAITNYRDPARTAPGPRSRGELPLQFLVGNTGPEEYLTAVAGRAGEYAGFNLLLGDHHDLWYLTNSDAGDACLPRRLSPGIYGLSNARLDTPWPKVELGKSRMRALLAGARPGHDALTGVVSDRQLAEPPALQPLGLPNGMDRLLSAQFIVTGTYGTRSSTSLWTDSSGLAHWREQSFDEAGKLLGVSEESFRLE